ncbi:hypothetical protein ABPG75_009291 [Micractinium tetrahymenae]
MAEWELDVALPAVPPTHIEENYRSLYALDADGTPGNDLALHLHPNGLCVADTVLGRQAEQDWEFRRLIAGGATYVLRCCCRGLLVEMNARLGDLEGSELLT